MLLDRLSAVPGFDELRACDAGGLWLVGGAVRDALLGQPVRDLDVVVEGDAIAVARELGEIVSEHERFGTAEVRLPGSGVKVNLAGARTETYARPGALPNVALGATVLDDLERRDFTVNAMAVALDDGRELEVTHAREDLAARRLRVLHDRSFTDDPTRILRMVRYAQRLDLAPDDHTAQLARAAVAGGALLDVTRDRIASELRLALHEPDPLATLAAMHDWTAGATPRVDVALARRALALLPEARLDLIAVASGAIGDERAAQRHIQWFDESRPARRHAAEAARADALAAALDAAQRPSQVVALARRRLAETVALAGALGAQAPARRYLDELRHVTLQIDGRDLLAAGVPEGPAIRAALDRALAARLDGTIAAGRDAELAAALDE
jgi:tRNA nucleotidyltransferase (CCA-adding enzyme)